jgi:hypothetical protein
MPSELVIAFLRSGVSLFSWTTISMELYFWRHFTTHHLIYWLSCMLMRIRLSWSCNRRKT